MKHIKIFENFETKNKESELLKDLFNSKDEWTGKMIEYAVYFEPSGDFGAITNAKNWLKEEGYVIGSMYSKYPIVFKKDDGFDNIIKTKHDYEERPIVITKWDRLNQYEQFDGILLPDPDFREGGVKVLFFNFPE